MTYVDGYLLAVPKKNLTRYKKMAREAGKVWVKHGALRYVEAVGDDLQSEMCLAHFPKAVRVKEGETVIFSFILFKSRKHRDQVNKKVFADSAMSADAMKDMPMPFDMKRMFYGGFEAIVDL